MSSFSLPRTLGFLLVLAAGSVLPGSASAGDTDFGPNDLQTVFYISKSDDKNRVDYGMRLDSHCAPFGQDPVFPYWREFEPPPPVRTKPMGAFSKLGYGVSTDGMEAIAKSLAIEFDTFTLKDLGDPQGDPFGDPNGNHISVHSRGPEPNNIDEAYSLGRVSEGLPSFKDGKPHNVKVSYAPGSMKIFVDSMEKPVLTVALKLDAFSGKDFKDASVLDADGKAWVGFTAGTGSLTENHDILSWKLTPQKAAGG